MRRSLVLLAVPLLSMALAVGCATSGEEQADRTTTTTGAAPIDGTSTTTSVPSRWGDLEPVDLTFRGVLAVAVRPAGGTCDDAGFEQASGARGSVASPGQVAPTTTTEPLTETEGAEVLGSRDGSLCYLVGPAAADGRDLAGAEATQSGEWQVTVDPRSESVDVLNGLFDACFQAASSCPDGTGSGHGQVAIAFGDQVLSAPTVNAAGIADQEFVISGSFTEAEARDLAAILDR
jgi:hypothetical protein